ncbi:MAG: 50S ribosomal protein L4 [Rubrobacteridae bacterium]|nr:50S ribosomal protein L4 [Rubrobacteridae bacterium]
MKLPVHDRDGKTIEEIKVNPAIFEVEVNPGVVHQVVRAQLAAARRGTAKTKTRSEVRGGGKKPWRQKGTGRARTGSIRAPHWVGGGTIFGPTPRDYSFSIPKKMRKVALRGILSAKAKEGNLIILDDFGLEAPKTKDAIQILKNLNVDKKATVIVGEDQFTAVQSVRNIENVRVIFSSELNAYDLLDNEYLVMTRAALGYVEGGLE